MTGQGASRIFQYNWPIFVATWTAGVAMVWAWHVGPALPALGLVGIIGVTALGWSMLSLLVSAYVYDRSPLSSASWIAAELRAPECAWVSIDAGLDGELDLDAVMRGACVARLDIFDPSVMTARSIGRARARTPRRHTALACRPVALPLEDAACDVVIVAFSAHEIRDVSARETFFAELGRVLRADGRVLVVEHTRDLANFLAFGPGFLHFLPRAEWLRLAAHANLSVMHETRVTPWVMALTLQKCS